MTKFGDFGKGAKDLLGKDYYQYDTKLKVKTTASNGVAFTTEGAMSGSAVKPAKVSAAFKPVDGITIKKLSAATNGTLVGEASLDDVMDGLKFTVKIEEGRVGGKDADKGELVIDFKGDGFVSNTTVNVIDGPAIKEDLAFKFDSFLLGGSVSYNTGFDKPADGGVKKYAVGAGYTDQDFNATLTANGTPGTDGKWGVDASFFHTYSPEINIAALLGIKDVQAPKPSLEVGGTCKMDSSSLVAGKADTNGVLSFGYEQKINSSVKLVTSAQVDATKFTEDSSDHKLGFNLSFSA
jgi:hypothetical protein